MPQIPSAAALIDQIKTDAANILNKDIALIAGFSENQLKMIAQHTVLIAKLAAAGGLQGEADRNEVLDGLQQMVRNFLAALQNLVLLTVEKLWNSVVDILWGTIDKAIGFSLPRPAF